MTAMCKQTDVDLSTCIEKLQIVPMVSHFQSLGFRANIEVQFSCQAQVILDLCCKTAFKGVSVMGPFAPVQKEWDKGSVSQICCISMFIRELISSFYSSSDSRVSSAGRVVSPAVVRTAGVSSVIVMGISVPA